MHVACVGIDLAWSERNLSGLALLELDAKKAQLELRETACLQSNKEIATWVKERCRQVTIVAVDAPIIAPNALGTGRPCDRELSSAFWRFHAGAYPANNVKCARPIGLRRRLEQLGFDVDPTKGPGRIGKWLIEVYPHPAQVVFFSLSRIVKYKKGTVAEKQRGQQQLADYIAKLLPRRNPRLIVNKVLKSLCIVQSLRGQALKGREDQLDAVICGYSAAYYWVWGKSRNRIFGHNWRTGYIVSPWPISHLPALG